MKKLEVNLATDAKERKTYPVATGFLDYFPLAAAEVAHVSFVGNEQHNPGTPLHWDRSKSTDEADALIRHFLQRGTVDSDGIRHSAKLAWRSMALFGWASSGCSANCGILISSAPVGSQAGTDPTDQGLWIKLWCISQQRPLH